MLSVIAFPDLQVIKTIRTGHSADDLRFAPDGSRAYVGVFRLAGSATSTYRLVPRGLDVARRYRVTIDNSRQTFEADGHILADSGCQVRVPGILQSELVLFEAMTPTR